MTLVERLALKTKFGGWITCPICGAFAQTRVEHANFRETILCASCQSTNRNRQIALVLCTVISKRLGTAVTSLKQLKPNSGLAIYNTEASGPTHHYLCHLPNYCCSEYFGPELNSGDRRNGVLHQDLMALSFPDNSFDFILSSDVLEHLPNPYQAHREIFRTLKPGGAHIFTVPFYQDRVRDETRAMVTAEGKVTHLLDPIFHHDPLRPEGILVYTIFSFEMLVKLEEIGFKATLYRLYRPKYGILGQNALVFEAVKSMNGPYG
jgi:SAM-dependent methyltransferase